MATYFVFSDQSGEYKSYPKPNDPKYCVRACLIVDSVHWIGINKSIVSLKEQIGLPRTTELKWKHINQYILGGEENSGPFKELSADKLIYYVKEALNIVNGYENTKVMFTVSINKPAITKISFGNTVIDLLKGRKKKQGFKDVIWMAKWHLQEILPRIEMEMEQKDDLALLFFDEDNKKVMTGLKYEYHRLYRKGKFIQSYAHIKDTLHFENSGHSLGVQLSDYLAGIFNGFLQGHEHAQNLMRECILPVLRTDPGNPSKILGYGIREVPRDDNDREMIELKLNKLKQPSHTIQSDDIPF